MTTDRLPPLTALRAFDAAARHMSFQKGAADLDVTPAALSFQIKSLEDHLGAPLFHRRNRAVTLTPAGEALAPGARDGFGALGAAWRAAQRAAGPLRLTVTADADLAALWLAPRLFDFAEAQPGIDLRLAAGPRRIGADRDDVDVALLCGDDGVPSGAHDRPLGGDWMTPVMSPALAREIRRPDDLITAPLLHVMEPGANEPPGDWANWFAAAGVHIRAWTGPRFGRAGEAIDAAVRGDGVLLGRALHCDRPLRDGRLVAPFDTVVVPESPYRFVCRKGRAAEPQIAAFEAWIFSETATLKDPRAMQPSHEAQP